MQSSTLAKRLAQWCVFALTVAFGAYTFWTGFGTLFRNGELTTSELSVSIASVLLTGMLVALLRYLHVEYPIPDAVVGPIFQGLMGVLAVVAAALPAAIYGVSAGISAIAGV